MTETTSNTEAPATLTHPDDHKLLYLYLEYCPGDFYWGWWFYTLEVDPAGNIDPRRYTWLERQHGTLMSLARVLGLPVTASYGRDYKAGEVLRDAFFACYPSGALIWKAGKHGEDYRLYDEGTIQPWFLLKQIRENQLLLWKHGNQPVPNAGLDLVNALEEIAHTAIISDLSDRQLLSFCRHKAEQALATMQGDVPACVPGLLANRRDLRDACERLVETYDRLTRKIEIEPFLTAQGIVSECFWQGLDFARKAVAEANGTTTPEAIPTTKAQNEEDTAL